VKKQAPARILSKILNCHPTTEICHGRVVTNFEWKNNFNFIFFAKIIAIDFEINKVEN